MKKWFLALVLCALTCVGPTFAQAATHSTALSWNAVTGAPANGTNAAQVISGYNVYRATAPGGYTFGKPFASVSGGTTTAYVDTTPTAGQTFYYVVTTLCSNCNTAESVASNEVQAITPLDAPPGPPNPPVLNKPVVQ